MFELYPAIDIHQGRCVRLTQGDYSTANVYDESPANAARRWVEALKTDATYPQAMQELQRRGNAAVPPLVDALARRETELRVRSLEVLSRLLTGTIPFDPFAGDDVRAKQLSALRKQLGL